MGHLRVAARSNSPGAISAGAFDIKYLIVPSSYFLKYNQISGHSATLSTQTGGMDKRGCFLDGLELPGGVWYFAVTNAKEQVFLEYPQQSFPETKRGRPCKHPVLLPWPNIRAWYRRRSIPTMGNDNASRRGKGPDSCRTKIPALFFQSCRRKPQLCEARGGNMTLSEEICRWWNKIFRL